MHSIAVFDLDGTIARRDTFAPFLRDLGSLRFWVGALRGSPWLAASVFDRDYRDKAKSGLLTTTLAGRLQSEVESSARRFAERMVAADFNQAVLDRVGAHKRAGDTVAVASATPALLAAPIAELLDIETVVATKLETVDGVLTGNYSGKNVRGVEKLNMVIREFGRPPDHGYGNLPDDGPLLDAAGQGFVVAKGRITSHRSGLR